MRLHLRAHTPSPWPRPRAHGRSAGARPSSSPCTNPLHTLFRRKLLYHSTLQSVCKRPPPTHPLALLPAPHRSLMLFRQACHSLAPQTAISAGGVARAHGIVQILSEPSPLGNNIGPRVRRGSRDLPTSAAPDARLGSRSSSTPEIFGLPGTISPPTVAIVGIACRRHQSVPAQTP
jgi:hypothetical protein